MTNGGQWRQWPCLVINLLCMDSGKGRIVWSHRIGIMFVYTEWNNILVTSSTSYTVAPEHPSSLKHRRDLQLLFSSSLLFHFIDTLISVDSLHAIRSLVIVHFHYPCASLILSIPLRFLHSFRTLSFYRQILQQCVEKTAFPVFSRQWLFKTLAHKSQLHTFVNRNQMWNCNVWQLFFQEKNAGKTSFDHVCCYR